jgi:hypothetical protein
LSSVLLDMELDDHSTGMQGREKDKMECS